MWRLLHSGNGPDVSPHPQITLAHSRNAEDVGGKMACDLTGVEALSYNTTLRLVRLAALFWMTQPIIA